MSTADSTDAQTALDAEIIDTDLGFMAESEPCFLVDILPYYWMIFVGKIHVVHVMLCQLAMPGTIGTCCSWSRGISEPATTETCHIDC